MQKSPSPKRKRNKKGDKRKIELLYLWMLTSVHILELEFVLTRRLSKLGTFKTHSLGSVGNAQQSLSESIILSRA
jgi:hypothetical protein